MRSIWVWLGVLWLATGEALVAGEKSWPARYKTPPKAAGVQVMELWGHPEQAPDFSHTSAFTPDGKLGLFTSGGASDGDGIPDDSYLTLWDLEKAVPLIEVMIPRSAVTCVALSTDGKRALVGLVQVEKGKGETYALSLWDMATGKRVGTSTKQDASLVAMALTSDGNQALIASMTGSLRLWDLKQGKAAVTFTTPENTVVAALALVPGSRKALTAFNSELRLWDLATGKEIRAFKGHQDNVINIAVSPDG
jgi:WD40 repeat protein